MTATNLQQFCLIRVILKRKEKEDFDISARDRSPQTCGRGKWIHLTTPVCPTRKSSPKYVHA